MTTAAIGNIERMNDPNFINRIILRKNTDTSLNYCPELKVINGEVVPQNVQLAELKSSLLINNILNNEATSGFLNDWVYLILTNIYGEKYDEVLQYYSGLIPDSTQKDNVDSYPVAQIKKFSADPAAIQSNFLAHYDFLKWSWAEFSHGTRTEQGEETSILSYYDCNLQMLQAMAIIDMIQQRVNNIINTTRGGRRDDLRELRKPWLRNATDQVGITDIYTEYLTRSVGVDPNEDWIHPGRSQCFVPYRGKYGDFLRHQHDNNTMYSSVQCGISASTNFGFYMTLIALATGRRTSLLDTPEDDARALITGVTTVLVGDGGHNVRETITGLTLTSIALKAMLDDLKAELATLNNGKAVNLITDADRIPNVPPGPCSRLLFDKAYTFRSKTLPSECLEKISQEFLFKNVVRAFGYWEEFINTIYGMLRHINPIAIWTADLNANNVGIIQNRDVSFTNAKNKMYDIYSSDNYRQVIGDPSLLLTTQVFTALDSNRDTLDPQTSFIDGPATTFTRIVSALPGGDAVIEETAVQMTETIDFCNSKYGTKPDGGNVINIQNNQIPLAFKGTVNRGPLMARNPKEYNKLVKFYGEDNVVLVKN
jgi:hypothetical protein